jgi:hypothetical protein
MHSNSRLFSAGAYAYQLAVGDHQRLLVLGFGRF